MDSTPWFVLLSPSTSGGRATWAWPRSSSPAIDAALDWIDHHGDLDGDGFVEYRCGRAGRHPEPGLEGLVDAVLHADGTRAEPPIALVEVQAYVHLAKLRIADVFEALGDPNGLRRRSPRPPRSRRFHRAFWMEDERYYAMALDGDKRQVRSVTSNPGHALYCDIVDPDRPRSWRGGCSRRTCSAGGACGP